MQLLADDISVHAFARDDGSHSAAIKIIHRTTRQEVVNDETDSQRENFRRALWQMVTSMNPNPDHIPTPEMILFDPVRVTLPESVHDGEITRISWDFTRSEWKYFVDCSNQVVSAWYVSADLDPRDELEDENEE